MHEYSVVADLVSALLPRLEEHPGEVTAVFLKRGELRILSDHALRSAFEIVTEGTRLEGASLEIEVVPVRVACDGCGYEGSVEYLKDEAFHFVIPILTCPQCGWEVKIVSGRELAVERVSIRTPSDAEV